MISFLPKAEKIAYAMVLVIINWDFLELVVANPFNLYNFALKHVQAVCLKDAAIWNWPSMNVLQNLHFF